MSSDSGNYPSYRKSRSTERMKGQIFDRKLLNSRFCACAVKICLKVLTAYHITKILSPLIGNRGR